MTDFRGVGVPEGDPLGEKSGPLFRVYRKNKNGEDSRGSGKSIINGIGHVGSNRDPRGINLVRDRK